MWSQVLGGRDKLISGEGGVSFLNNLPLHLAL